MNGGLGVLPGHIRRVEAWNNTIDTTDTEDLIGARQNGCAILRCLLFVCNADADLCRQVTIRVAYENVETAADLTFRPQHIITPRFNLTNKTLGLPAMPAGAAVYHPLDVRVPEQDGRPGYRQVNTCGVTVATLLVALWDLPAHQGSIHGRR